jgi:mannosyltransferase
VKARLSTCHNLSVGTRTAPLSHAATGNPVLSKPVGQARTLAPLWILAALTLFAAVLRFATLDVQSAWLDESATIVLVQRGFGGMLSHLSSSESAPPLYYVLVWGWTKVFGSGVLGFRSFSATIGTLTIPILYAVGREISARVGLWLAALATVSPIMYYYSQEARCYALLILFSAAAIVYWQRAMRAPDGRSLALWSALSALALLTHYFAVFLFVPEAILLVRRAGVRPLRAPIGAVVLVGIALAPLAYSQRADGKADWIQSTSLAARVGQAAKQFLVGLYGPVEILTAIVAGLLAAAAVVLTLRASESSQRRMSRDIAIVACGAIALPLLLSLTHVLDVFNGRNVIAAWTPWALLVAIGLGAAGAARLGAALGIGLCLLSLLVVVAVDLTPGYQRDDWRGAAAQLQPRAAERVIVIPENGSLPLGIYMPGLRETEAPRLAAREIDFVALRTRRTDGSPLAPVLPSKPPPGFRLAAVKRAEAYAVARYVATRKTAMTAVALRRLAGEPGVEIAIQR